MKKDMKGIYLRENSIVWNTMTHDLMVTMTNSLWRFGCRLKRKMTQLKFKELFRLESNDTIEI